MPGLSTRYAVLAPPLHRTRMSAPPRSGCTVTVTAAMTSRSRRLRSTGVVVSACQSAGRSRGQAAHLLDFDADRGAQLGLAQALVLFLQLRDLASAVFPAALQLAGDQAIVGIHRVVLPLRQAGLVTRTFEAKLPLPVQRPGAPAQARAGRPAWPPARRAARLQERLPTTCVDRAGDEGLAHRPTRSRSGPGGTRSGAAVRP